jgi:hypothetical protein
VESTTGESINPMKIATDIWAALIKYRFIADASDALTCEPVD